MDSGRSCRSAVSSLTFAQPVLHRTGPIGDRLANSGIKVIDIGKSAVIEDSPDLRCVLPSQSFLQAVERL